MWMWTVTPSPSKPCEMKSLRHQHHGTRLLLDNPFGGFSRDRYPGAVRSGVWEIHGWGQVYEEYPGTTAKWLGFCKGHYEALSQYETGAICQSYYPYVSIFCFSLLICGVVWSDFGLGERKLLADVPNVLSYQRILETGTGGYLVRQYIHSSLYDRMR